MQRRDWLIIAIITLATLVVYEPVRKNGFISYDDDEYIVNNPHVTTGLTGQNLRWAVTTSYAANWHPLTWLSHMVDCQLFGLNAGGHHVVNAFIHLANSLLLYGVLFWMTGARWPSALVAVLFAVHPLHVESVAWASERKDTLSTFFGFATIASYVWYVRKQTALRYVAVFVCLALGLMAKPMLVTWPLVLLLLDYWPLRRSGGVRRVIMEKIPLLVLSAGACWITIHGQRQWGAVDASLPLAQRVSNAIINYFGYAAKTFVPMHLGIAYPHPAALGTQPSMMLVVLAAAVLVAMTAVFVLLRRKFPYLLVGWLLYLGTLVPVIGIVQVGSQGLADRYAYIPSMGLFIAVAWLMWDLVKRMWGQSAIVTGAWSMIVVVLALAARRQVLFWNDSISFFTHSVAVIPNNFVGQIMLASTYGSGGKRALAIEHYQRALAMFPPQAQQAGHLGSRDYAGAENNLGACLYEQDDYRGAIEHDLAALKARPRYADAHTNLANAYDALGQDDLAMQHYEAAIGIQPDLAQPHFNLGILLARQGKIDEAIEYFKAACRINPNYARAQHALSYALGLKGRYSEAIVHEREALRVSPNWAEAQNHLRWLEIRAK